EQVSSINVTTPHNTHDESTKTPAVHSCLDKRQESLGGKKANEVKEVKLDTGKEEEWPAADCAGGLEVWMRMEKCSSPV
ncbi:Retinoic acid early-inducible protein 1-beta, partial [Dissostichus eleginoides]